MTREHDDEISDRGLATDKKDSELDSCWEDLLNLVSDQITLNQIFVKAEKLVQHYGLKNPKLTDQLCIRIAAKQQSVAAEIAARADDPSLKCLQAALAGALAGCMYPLGWSPRDLNHMAF
jgi:hypothetical protein